MLLLFTEPRRSFVEFWKTDMTKMLYSWKKYVYLKTFGGENSPNRLISSRHRFTHFCFVDKWTRWVLNQLVTRQKWFLWLMRIKCGNPENKSYSLLTIIVRSLLYWYNWKSLLQILKKIYQTNFVRQTCLTNKNSIYIIATNVSFMKWSYTNQVCNTHEMFMVCNLKQRGMKWMP